MDASGIDTTAAASAGQQTTTAGLELGRNDFMRLLVAKLENQDPLKPASDSEFVAELATFSSLEQLISVNANLETLSLAQAQLIDAQSLNLIGKEALIEAGGELSIRDGRPDTIIYTLPRAAAEATLSLVNDKGETVRTFKLEGTPGERQTLSWDEKKLLPDGDYRIELDVTAADGEPMAIALFRSVPIEGVSFFEGQISLISGQRQIPFESILEIRESRRGQT